MYTNLPSQFPAKKEVGYATPQNQHLRNLKPPKCTTGIHLKGPIEVYGPIVLGTSNTIRYAFLTVASTQGLCLW